MCSQTPDTTLSWSRLTKHIVNKPRIKHQRTSMRQTETKINIKTQATSLVHVVILRLHVISTALRTGDKHGLGVEKQWACLLFAHNPENKQRDNKSLRTEVQVCFITMIWVAVSDMFMSRDTC